MCEQQKFVTAKGDYSDFMFYAPDEDEIIVFSEGTGDNLLPEDEEEGYVDYIYYTRMDVTLREDDGGMIMLEELFRDKYDRTEAAINDVLYDAYGAGEVKYIPLVASSRRERE